MHIQTSLVRNSVRMAPICAMLALLQSCSPLPTNQESAVLEAYKSSDAVIVKPYTRSIINSNNF